MASNYLDKNGLSYLKSKIAAMIAARVIDWSEIQGKPNTFAPSSHVHDVATTAANGFMSSDDKTKLNGIAANANNYTLPTAGQDKLGGVKTSSSVTNASGYTACPIIGGVVYYKDTNTTYTLTSFGITATAAELNKLDGATVTVQEINYLDGVTSNIQSQLNGKASSSHGHSAATQSAAGYMSSSDKIKLDGIAAGANKYTHPSNHPASMIQITVGSSTVALSDVIACAIFPISQTDEYVEFGDINEWVNAGKPKL